HRRRREPDPRPGTCVGHDDGFHGSLRRLAAATAPGRDPKTSPRACQRLLTSPVPCYTLSVLSTGLILERLVLPPTGIGGIQFPDPPEAAEDCRRLLVVVGHEQPVGAEVELLEARETLLDGHGAEGRHARGGAVLPLFEPVVGAPLGELREVQA